MYGKELATINILLISTDAYQFVLCWNSCQNTAYKKCRIDDKPTHTITDIVVINIAINIIAISGASGVLRGMGVGGLN